jgi:hypothetical protein
MDVPAERQAGHRLPEGTRVLVAVAAIRVAVGTRAAAAMQAVVADTRAVADMADISD